MAGCGPDWAGLSLTMPLKRAVLSLLDDAEPLVAEVGAANTVRFEAGLRHGHNTDVAGLIAALLARVDDPTDLDRRSAPGRCHGQGPAGADPGISPDADRGGRARGSHPGRWGDRVFRAGRGARPRRAEPTWRSGTRGGRRPAVRRGRLGADRPVGRVRCPGRSPPGLLISTAPGRRGCVYTRSAVQRGALRPGCVLDVVYQPWPTALAAAARAGRSACGWRLRAAAASGRPAGPADDRPARPRSRRCEPPGLMRWHGPRRRPSPAVRPGIPSGTGIAVTLT